MRTGLTAHPLWIVWLNMRRRCYYEKHPDYKYYGARGISYAKKWDRFKGFLEDMGPSYKPGLTLDRIDNDGHYIKENCQWLSPKDNNRKKRGVKLTMEKATEIRRRLKGGTSLAWLAQEYEVSKQLICDIRAGRAWT